MSLSCQDAARLLSEKRDRRLPWRTRITLRLHMLACKMCKIYSAQHGVVSHVCKEAGIRAEDMCPGEMSEERKRRMKEAMLKRD